MDKPIDELKKTVFCAPMPNMPDDYRDAFNAAFMLRRKYIDLNGRKEDELFAALAEDMIEIARKLESTNTVMLLLTAVMNDVEQKWIASYRNSADS